MERSSELPASRRSPLGQGGRGLASLIAPHSRSMLRPTPCIESVIQSHRPALSRDRRRARKMISDLKLPVDPELSDVVQAVQRFTGRTILVKDLELARGLSGFCLRLEDLDLLAGTTRSSPRRRIHVRLHELGHLLFDTQADGVPPDTCSISSHNLISKESIAAELAPLLPTSTVEKVLSRPIQMRKSTCNHLTDPVERLPETFALEVLSILQLDEQSRGSGPIATAFGHRGTTL